MQVAALSQNDYGVYTRSTRAQAHTKKDKLCYWFEEDADEDEDEDDDEDPIIWIHAHIILLIICSHTIFESQIQRLKHSLLAYI